MLGMGHWIDLDHHILGGEMNQSETRLIVIDRELVTVQGIGHSLVTINDHFRFRIGGHQLKTTQG